MIPPMVPLLDGGHSVHVFDGRALIHGWDQHGSIACRQRPGATAAHMQAYLKRPEPHAATSKRLAPPA
jgi:hypothetical protein